MIGAVRDLWGRLGGENSALGLPTTNEYGIADGVAQDFQYGRISWPPAGGAVVTGAATAGGGILPLGVVPPGTQAVTVTAPSGTSTGPP